MPHPLRREFPGHEIVTAQFQGWAELENGDLVDAAENAGFDALMTADKKFALSTKSRRAKNCDSGFTHKQIESFTKYHSANSHEIGFAENRRVF
ncbi:MAG: hypothetical protein ABUL66_03715 [Verrucomicrobiota bacterium]